MLVTKPAVRLPRGLQARHTTLFVRKAAAFTSEIVLAKNGQTANGKDLMEIINLAVQEGDKITLIINGADERAVKETLEKFLLNL
ncbi:MULTISPECIES: HPr family phosphocarrier protein [Bacillus]|uniref:HPr family phosphocarrier protein n=1 Tax=Bacillus TaxID=1386 RepID=UPI00098B6C06|nr:MULTISPECIES: HPr family phosphocarrier protein [Bacillus]WFA07196.1 HPr family phosphocarrier protein [Bacillus sp. HSf4]